jgi:hypothetical protein
VYSDESLTAFVEVEFAIQQAYREANLCCSHSKKGELPKSDFWSPELLSSVCLFSLCTEHGLVMAHRGGVEARKIEQSE